MCPRSVLVGESGAGSCRWRTRLVKLLAIRKLSPKPKMILKIIGRGVYIYVIPKDWEYNADFDVDLLVRTHREKVILISTRVRHAVNI